MNDSAVSIEMLKDILVDPDVESVCPPLTEDEFSLLEQNILSDGEVTSPLIVWDNKLIDGHHRRQIILKHPELPFQIKEAAFNNKYEAIAWICKNQAGRRNLTPEQLSYLIGKRYEAEKHTNGASDGFRGNQHVDVVRGKNYPVPTSHATAIRIADENGISEKSVRLFGEYHKLMFQIGTSKGACLHLGDTARVHVATQQRTKDDTDAAFALAALADQQEHLLSFGGGDKAIPHELLQGKNVLRLQKLR